MKELLQFLDEGEFQSFCSQLLSAEYSTYLPIEGSGGDGGLDGLDNTIAFQMYFPEQKHRNSRHYIEKIDDTLIKVLKTIREKNLIVTQWILVVPEDMRYDIVIHLQSKTKEVGFSCLYWGSTKLKELVGRHPHIRNSFPSVFLPDVKEDLGDVKVGLHALGRSRNALNIEIITDAEFRQIDNALSEEYRTQARSVVARFGTDSSAHLQADEQLRQRIKVKKEELRRKKAASDRAYELDKEEIVNTYTQLKRDKLDEMAQRGLFSSGVKNRDMAELESKRLRELERLQLLYGKEEPVA